MNFTIEPKAFQSFEWTHIVLVLGALGIVSVGGVNFSNKEKTNEETSIKYRSGPDVSQHSGR